MLLLGLSISGIKLQAATIDGQEDWLQARAIRPLNQWQLTAPN
jgi:hypothetical protein